MWHDQWWVWMSAALVLAGAEALVPGWIFFGFAVGAFVLGGLLLLGVTGLSMPITLVIFAILSLAAFLAMRRIFGLKRGQVTTFDHDINDN